MKAVLFSMICMTSVFSFAAAECPKDSQSVLTCTSTPGQTDQKKASIVFDSLALCAQGSTTTMVMVVEGDGDSSNEIVSKITVRPDGTDFEAFEPKMIMTLSVPADPKASQLFIDLDGGVMSSAYTCVK